MWRAGLLLAAPAFAQGFDSESGIPEGGLHPRFPAGYVCPPITSYFGSMLDVDGTLREAAHKGIDLGNWGDAILAPADGMVVAAWATDVGYGPEWNLLMSHSAADMGLAGSGAFYSEFDHLGADAAGLQAGQRVRRGEKLATVRVPGGVRAYIAETHWETLRLPMVDLAQTYWADNGLEQGFLTWFNPAATLANPLALMALHQTDRKAAKIIAFDPMVDYSGFAGFTYPLLCRKN